MTLPKPCPKPDCHAPITHYHGDSSGDIYACTATLNGGPCPHGQDSPCYAPRETAPLHLPDVDAVARKIFDSDYGANWDARNEGVKDFYRRSAQAVLDLIAAHQPVWQRVEPGTLIKEGTRYRRETLNGPSERIAAGDFLTGGGVYSIDPRTVPPMTDRTELRPAETVAETVPTRHESPDVAELRRKAEACQMPDNGPDALNWWHKVTDLIESDILPVDAEFIAAASPDVVEGLLDRLAHMTEARDAARAEVERLTALLAEVRDRRALLRTRRPSERTQP